MKKAWLIWMIIGQETVITGGFNFTEAAEEKNGENFLMIKERALAGKYSQYWKAHEDHSQTYSG